MSVKQLTIAAAFVTFALAPSVTDVARAHTTEPETRWLIYGWALLAVLLLAAVGEELLGRTSG